MSPPPIELSPQVRNPVWNCWNWCLPSADGKGKESKAAGGTSNVPAGRPFGGFSVAGGIHHKQLSLIVEETESKLRLEMESDGSFRKQSVGSSITSSSSSSTGGGSTPARSATVVVASRCQTKDTSPPHDLLLTETTEEEEEEDDALKGKSSDSGQHPYQMVARSDGGTGAGSAILELAWRVVVSLLFLGLFRPRNQQQRQPSATMKTPDDSGGAAASVVDAVDDECTFLTPPPSPQSSSLLRRHGGDRDQEEGSGFT